MPRIGLTTFALIVLAGTPFIATGQPSAEQGGLKPSNSVTGSDHRNKMICRSQGDSSSRLRRQRVCATRAEWDEQQRTERLHVEKAQTNRIWPPG